MDRESFKKEIFDLINYYADEMAVLRLTAEKAGETSSVSSLAWNQIMGLNAAMEGEVIKLIDDVFDTFDNIAVYNDFREDVLVCEENFVEEKSV